MTLPNNPDWVVCLKHFRCGLDFRSSYRLIWSATRISEDKSRISDVCIPIFDILIGSLRFLFIWGSYLSEVRIRLKFDFWCSYSGFPRLDSDLLWFVFIWGSYSSELRFMMFEFRFDVWIRISWGLYSSEVRNRLKIDFWYSYFDFQRSDSDLWGSIHLMFVFVSSSISEVRIPIFDVRIWISEARIHLRFVFVWISDGSEV